MEIAESLPELPDEKKARFMALGLSAYDASVLVAERETRGLLRGDAAPRARTPKSAANWLNNEILGRLNRDGLSIVRCVRSVRPPTTRSSQMIADKTISGKIAKDLLDIVWSEGGDPRVSRREPRTEQVTDTGAIEAAIDAVIAANPDKVEEVKAKPKLAGWFVGQVMKADGRKSQSGGRQRHAQDRDSICPTRGDSHKLRKSRTLPDNFREFLIRIRNSEFNPLK